MKGLIYCICASMLIVSGACSQTISTTDDIHYGEKITEDGARSFNEVMSQLESNEAFETKVIANVQKVCKKKGCWVTLNETNSGKEDMFVKFKDYGFFLPLDCDGSRVVMEGKAFKEITPIEELKHYAEDEGKTAEEIAMITEPKVEYKFMASGVKMLK